MALVETMEIEFPTFFLNISKIFLNYRRGPVFPVAFIHVHLITRWTGKFKIPQRLSVIHSFVIHSFIHRFVRSFVHSFVRSFTHSFIYHSFIHSFIHSFFHSFIHLFIHSLPFFWRSGNRLSSRPRWIRVTITCVTGLTRPDSEWHEPLGFMHRIQFQQIRTARADSRWLPIANT